MGIRVRKKKTINPQKMCGVGKTVNGEGEEESKKKVTPSPSKKKIEVAVDAQKDEKPIKVNKPIENNPTLSSVGEVQQLPRQKLPPVPRKDQIIKANILKSPLP